MAYTRATDSIVLQGLADDRHPTWTTADLAALSADDIAGMFCALDNAMQEVGWQADHLRCYPLPGDAMMLYWRLRRVKEEMEELKTALAEESGRRLAREAARHEQGRR